MIDDEIKDDVGLDVNVLMKEVARLLKGLDENLLVFIEKAEKEIFNPEEIAFMDMETLLDRHERARNVQTKVLELTCKAVAIVQKQQSGLLSESGVNEMAQKIRNAVNQLNLSVPGV